MGIPQLTLTSLLIMREVRANSLKGFASPSTKRVGLELSTHKRKSRQPQSVQHFSLFWGDSYYPPVGGGRGLGGSASEGSSSDELNNKRCKYDNFSQDVASNNKIKIIPKVSKVTGQSQSRQEGRWSGEPVAWNRTGFAVTTAQRAVSCVCSLGAQENIQFVASFLFRQPDCLLPYPAWHMLKSNCVGFCCLRLANLIDLFFMPKRITRRRGADYS